MSYQEKEGKINTTSTNCGWSQHYYQTDQGQRNQNSYEQHVCKFARRGSFQHKVIQKYTLCTVLENEEIEMARVECTLKHGLPPLQTDTGI